MKILPMVCCTFVLTLACVAQARAAGDTRPPAVAQQQLQRDREKMQRDQQRLEQDQQALERDQQGLGLDQQTLQANQQQLEKQMEQARKQMQQAAQRMAQLSLQMEGPMIVRLSHMFDPNRAVLGVSIADNRNRQNAPGVRVLAVTPGGPAERADLRTGDTITSINGTLLRSNARRSAADQLIGFMDKVKPGDMLRLDYVRDGRGHSTTVKAGRLSDYNFAVIAPPPAAMRAGSLRALFPPGWWGTWGGMQLAQLTPGLGQYFGADKGLLVVRAPRDAALKLEDGDVILKIGDREPVTPSEAMRIFYSYAPGETLTLHILRKGKPLSFSIVAPQSSGPAWGPYRPMNSRAP
jgi:C-terminal processing protease CtpA/Prc